MCREPNSRTATRESISRNKNKAGQKRIISGKHLEIRAGGNNDDLHLVRAVTVLDRPDLVTQLLRGVVELSVTRFSVHAELSIATCVRLSTCTDPVLNVL